QPHLVPGFRERQEDVLRPADRERGDEGEAAAVDDLLDLPQERVLRLEPLRMLPPRVRRFDEQRVAMDGTGAQYEVRGERVQVPGEQGRLGPVHLVHRRAGDVARGMGGNLEVADVHVVPEIDRPGSAPGGPVVRMIPRPPTSEARPRNWKAIASAVDGPGRYKTFALPGRKSRWHRIARAIRCRPRRTIAASSNRSDPKNRSAKRLMRTPSAKGPPTAVPHRASYSSSGVPSRR